MVADSLRAKILIVEDEQPGVRTLLVRRLERDYDVAEPAEPSFDEPSA